MIHREIIEILLGLRRFIILKLVLEVPNSKITYICIQAVVTAVMQMSCGCRTEKPGEAIISPNF